MHRLVASWFGSGLILRSIRGSDSGSGTVGALFAAIPAYLLYQLLAWPLQVAVAIAVVLIGIWSVGPLIAEEGDAGWIVIDEAAGTFIALIGLGLWPGAVVGFITFRFADIFKRFFPGVGPADRASGPAAIMGDDVIAGVYALLAGHAVQTLV